MGPIAITVVIAAGFAGFCGLAWRKLAIVRALQPEPRWDHVRARLVNVLTLGLLQTRMIGGEPRPGIMHAVIFVGFMTLLVRKVQLLIIGYDPLFVYPGTVGGLYAAFKDFIGLAVTSAVLYGFWRRFVVKPRRLEPNREAILVLSLILAIMVTDFLYDGFKFALLAGNDGGLAHEAAFAFVGGPLGAALAQLPASHLALGYHGFYWIQIATVFGFLLLLPLGEHFHIVTALPNLFFSRFGPANRVPGVDLDAVMNGDGEGELKVGARTARDLTWKEALDAFSCTECGRCKDSCPTFLTDKPLSLKWVNDSVKRHLVARRAAILAGNDDALPPLVGEVIGADTLWACTTCGYCEAACPIELEHLPKFFRLRQHQVLMEGAFPPELKAVFDGYESQGNPWGLPADTRGDWAKGLGVPVVDSPQQAAGLDYLFYVGSAQSFDARGRKVARAFVKILRAANVKFAILGAAEGSTGECVRRAGNEMLFQDLARRLAGTLNGFRVARIVTCDPHAFNSLRNEYPEFGGRYQVLHHTQLLGELLDEGRIPVRAAFERVLYHDPCYLGRHNGVYDAPRRVLRRLCRDEPPEFDLKREKSLCCGAGGGRMWMEERIGARINVLRAEQALARAPALIATACPYCALMLYDGVAQLGAQESVPVRDLAELVAEALGA